MVDAPAECAAARVANGHGLGWRVLLPWTAVNARLVGVALMAGGTGAAVTVKETGIVTGVTPVPPLKMTEPVWVPGAKAPVVACKVTVPLPVPVPVERVNQPVFSLAVQLKVPPCCG